MMTKMIVRVVLVLIELMKIISRLQAYNDDKDDNECGVDVD